MAEINWTKAQLNAIEVNAERILVSAAAGSGKSTVLTERIIRKITDQENGYDLQNLLVVTYTRASADDLRNKITKALNEALAVSPGNKHLEDQLMKLPAAKINTIHGVCLNLIKSNFEKLGLSASVSVADETVTSALRLDVMNKLLDYCFGGLFAPIPDFADFCENFITERDDSLVSTLLDLYDKMKNEPDGFKTANDLDFGQNGKDFLLTPFGDAVINKILLICDYYKKVLSDSISYFNTEELYAKFIPYFSDTLNYIETLKNAVSSKNTSILREIATKEQEPIPAKINRMSSADKTELGEFYRSERNAFFTELKGVCNDILSYTDQQILNAAQRTADISKKLTALLMEFDTRFTEAKRKRGLIDFNDIEHYTLKLLYDKDKNLTPLAINFSSSLSEIYVDEYQDLNPLQNLIFAALSKKCPIFMVGDIKQSIYGFRGADPSAFADFKCSFPKFDTMRKYKDVTVFLSENFRSLEPITDFANAISDAMFITPRHESFLEQRIPYEKADRLICGAERVDNPPEVSILNCTPEKVKGGSSENKASTRLEAAMVANEISALISSGVKPNDIAILLRSTSTNAPIFEKALRKRNIPISTDKGAKLFDAPEVQLALCILNCIDNPYRDIFLSGALRSPIFGFTLDDLIKIKRSSPDSPSLFDALTEYTVKEGFEKGHYFLNFLAKMRRFAMDNTPDKLLWHIYDETAFFSIIHNGKITKSEAETRRANLLLLHDLAKSYSVTGGTVFSLLERIRILIEQDKSPNASSTDGNGVKLMTMHASKGLEFEYCFVCNLGTTFTYKDGTKDICYEHSIGFAAKLKDELMLTKSDTPHRIAINYKKELLWINEEMRMLYVALTRAKKKLFLTSSMPSFEKAQQELSILKYVNHPYAVLRIHNFMKWILIGLAKATDIKPKYSVNILTKEEIELDEQNAILPDISVSDNSMTLSNEENTELEAKIKEKVDFTYKHKHSPRLPSKLSVSRLYPEILDEEIYLGGDTLLHNKFDLENELRDKKEENLPDMKVPEFMLGEIKPTPADKGTATHLFMQFCDFDNLEKNGVEVEIQRLVEKRFILNEHADLIDKSVIERFLNTDIFAEMKKSSSLMREYRFNIKLPASEFTANDELKAELDGEYVFVQGIIDCYFRDEKGEITLLDYKTDLVPKEILGNTKKENEFFTNRHATQLSYYKQALKILTGQDVYRCVVFSFALGRCIEIHK